METSGQLPVSKHFRLQQLADGVHAVIHIDGGAAIGNTVSDLGAFFPVNMHFLYQRHLPKHG